MIVDYLKNLSATQIVFLSLGVVLLIISSKDSIISFIKGLLSKRKLVDTTPSNKINLTSIVSQWETLSNSCKQANLNDAYNKLQEVFPMLISVYSGRTVKNNDEK